MAFQLGWSVWRVACGVLGQGRAGLGRADQGRADQGRAWQGLAGQGRLPEATRPPGIDKRLKILEKK